MLRLSCLSLLLLLVSAYSLHGGEGANDPIVFEKHVRPILKANCFRCHGENEKPEGGLDLRLRRLIVEGGDSGPGIAPGKPEKSLLLYRVSQGEMPPDENSKKLSKQQIAILRRWIAAGANTARAEPDQLDADLFISEEDRRFWSFQPIRRPKLPAVRTTGRVRSPIDAFVLARLEAKGLAFSADADKRTLLRRAYFDLLGLPPTPEAIERFVADDAPDAYARLIDRLLASPHYGERWGRHWLDVSGYADSEGYTNADIERKFAYKYRDYVIDSFNADKPADQFIQEQLAGDEMVSRPYRNLTAEDAQKLIATGFLRMAPDGTGEGGSNTGVARNDVVADAIVIVSTSLLGLTVGCAQCHAHRYDPISHQDYYRFRAIFEPALDWKNWRTPAQRLISLYTDADRNRSKEIETKAKKIDQMRLKKQREFINRTFERELAKLPENLRETIRAARDTTAKKRTPEQKLLLKKYPTTNVTAGSLYLYDKKAADELKKIAARAAKIRATKPKEEYIRALTEVPDKAPATYLFARGDHEQPKQKLSPAELRIVSLTSPEGKSKELPLNSPSLPSTGRRLAYARRLTDGTHPLLARVLVNRIWLHHFGHGIVDTPGDFGALGGKPSHPKLLDWLASELMENGWSFKRLHRLIMTASVYRQSTRRDDAARRIDPDHRFYAGMPLRRLEAEAIRDSILAVSGALNPKPFGQPIPVMADRVGQFVIGKENLNAGRPGAVVPMQGEQFRRSVYVQVRRSRPLAVLDTFDMPAMSPNCELRARSTVAPQSLMMMNNDFIVEQSEQFARRVRRDAAGDVGLQAARAWLLAFGREPSREELDDAMTFIAEQSKIFRQRISTSKQSLSKSKNRKASKADIGLQSLASFCQILLASNEFLYID